MTTGLLLIGGLALLFVGGEFLVRGAVLLAARLGVSPLMIGLTVVGFGTSTPELVTSLQAALAGAPGLAVGNVVGSNIANVLLILALAALIAPIPCVANKVWRDGGLMLAAGLALAALAFTSTLGRLDGAALLAGLALYLGVLWYQERITPGPTAAPAEIAPPTPHPGAMAAAIELALLFGGIAGVVLGGGLLVEGAIAFAAAAGISDAVIGLTVVAVGTSLPELATSVVAALRKQSDIAYGNIVGSNIFNVLGIAGVTALVVPITVPVQILRFDIPVMIAASVVMVIFAATGRRVSRGEGVVLLVGYGAYLTLLFA